MFSLTQSYYKDSPKRNWLSNLGWIHAFVLLQFILQIMLLFPQFGVLRVFMRIASFALSIFLLFWLKGSGLKHPAKGAAIAIIVIIVLNFFWHPSLNSILAGLAQCAMYVAILGPLFWVSRLQITPRGFFWLILLLWAFNTISSVFGVLQVNYPGEFQPFVSTEITGNVYGGDNYKIILADGTEIFRPMGLTDRPGGAASSGLYALLMGMGLFFGARNPLLRVACVGSIAIGLFCIYLSQIRSTLVFTLICVIIFAVFLLRQGRFGQLTTLLAGASAIALFTLSWAIGIGGEETSRRLTSLVSERPDIVYQQNRGFFLTNTIQQLLPQYPLGAGLGRWGPINGYFGNNSNPVTRSLYVEIQWTGWLFDGGVPLIIAYAVALLLTCREVWAIATDQRFAEMNLWAGLIFAYNVGALAITFNYPLFISQGGMEFWLLNTALFVAAHNYLKQQQPMVR